MIYLSVRSLTPGVLTPVGRDVCMYVCMYVCICESMAHSLAIPPSLLQTRNQPCESGWFKGCIKVKLLYLHLYDDPQTRHPRKGKLQITILSSRYHSSSWINFFFFFFLFVFVSSCTIITGYPPNERMKSPPRLHACVRARK
jgi:hypothetical protein